MKIKGLILEDFLQYKKPSMFIVTNTCTFKCEKECGKPVCQNSTLINKPERESLISSLVNIYTSNDITKAVVFGGLEPFDQFEDVFNFVVELRKKCDDDIVIYTGYYENEISDKIEQLKKYKNIIVKFGRFIPDQESHLDIVLGVQLASPNQYAEKIS